MSRIKKAKAGVRVLKVDVEKATGKKKKICAIW